MKRKQPIIYMQQVKDTFVLFVYGFFLFVFFVFLSQSSVMILESLWFYKLYIWTFSMEKAYNRQCLLHNPITRYVIFAHKKIYSK